MCTRKVDALGHSVSCDDDRSPFQVHPPRDSSHWSGGASVQVQLCGVGMRISIAWNTITACEFADLIFWIGDMNPSRVILRDRARPSIDELFCDTFDVIRRLVQLMRASTAHDVRCACAQQRRVQHPIQNDGRLLLLAGISEKK